MLHKVEAAPKSVWHHFGNAYHDALDSECVCECSFILRLLGSELMSVFQPVGLLTVHAAGVHFEPSEEWSPVSEHEGTPEA